ncbi:sigma-54 dependent transcriptional regulator [Salicola sp. Rm-C-2C1-2]|uniref:sigma-54-dependent transcriptional regulator n=1 Tax=Salicola sp. Rm-C-2C1-2 TaxID=3141321 RepID=UPI0032E4E1E1
MSDYRALIVDDEPDIRELLDITLSRMAIECTAAATLSEARDLLANQPFHLCLTDMSLPDGNGIDLVDWMQSQCPGVPVAVITAYGSMDSAITALKTGAFDFVSKPVELPRLRELVESALRLPADTGSQSKGDDRPDEDDPLLGDSPEIDALRRQARKVARSQAPVYISGESGSGKELVARLIHEHGPRRSHRFVPVNCGAIPQELMESEFFGHRKGSFTGATENKDGLFQAAHQGTLFLDEVADLPMPMQVKLLRAIQEKRIRPVGAKEETAVDVRVLSATHRNLAALVEDGLFRQDLFYRINVIELRVPSLRERTADIPILAQHILARLAQDYELPPAQLSKEALTALQAHPFPGNVRELENCLERAFTLSEDDAINASDLQLGGPSKTPEGGGNAGLPDPAESGMDLESYLESIERTTIDKAMAQTEGNKTAAARQLGVSFRALRYKLKKLGME